MSGGTPSAGPTGAETVEVLRARATSPGWQEAQRRYMAAYEGWGESRGLTAEDMEDPRVLAIWLNVTHPDWAWSTASHAVSAIGSAFRATGRRSPSEGEVIRRLLVTYRRRRPVGMAPTAPLLPSMLMLEPAPRPGSPEMTAEVLTAILSLGTLGGYTVPELARLRASDIELDTRSMTLPRLTVDAAASPLQASAIQSVRRLMAIQGPETGLLLEPVYPLTGTRDSVLRIEARLHGLLRESAARAGISPVPSTKPHVGAHVSPATLHMWMTEGAPWALQRLRNRAVLLCGLGHRAADLARLNLSEFRRGTTHSEALLPRSKSDLAGQGRVLYWEHTGRSSCPHCALEAWVVTLSRRFPGYHGPLFPVIKGVPMMTRLTAAHVTQIVRWHCRLVGLRPDAYSSRSLRVGGATAMAEAGADLDEITFVTGHRTAESAAMYLRLDAVPPARLAI